METLAPVKRYKALLRVNKVALSQSTVGGVFQGMCVALRKLLDYDRAALTLYDPDHGSLRIVALYGRYTNSIFQVGYLLARKASQEGWTFDHRTGIVRRDLEKDSQFPSDTHNVNEGFPSLCSVPLIVRGNSFGVVTVSGARKNQFSAKHPQLVQEISNQIVLAINSITLSCPVHPNTKLFCPRCVGAVGGRTTVAKHRENLSNWGKKGGRGRKRADFS